MKKAQILALTIFILSLSLSILMVLLMPINQQVIRIRKLLHSMQALSYAESGLEVGNFYVLKGQDLISDYTKGSSGQDLQLCNQYYNYACAKTGQNICAQNGYQETLDNCQSDLLTSNNAIVNVYFAKVYKTQEPSIYSFYSKVISEGSESGIKRILDFDFLP